MEGEVNPDAPKAMVCTDTRDGEVFSYQTKNISNIRIGFAGADSCADVVIDTGEKRLICGSQAAWIKCEPKP